VQKIKKREKCVGRGFTEKENMGEKSRQKWVE
jgi:hypothetical protein